MTMIFSSKRIQRYFYNTTCTQVYSDMILRSVREITGKSRTTQIQQHLVSSHYCIQLIVVCLECFVEFVNYNITVIFIVSRSFKVWFNSHALNAMLIKIRLLFGLFFGFSFLFCNLVLLLNHMALINIIWHVECNDNGKKTVGTQHPNFSPNV